MNHGAATRLTNEGLAAAAKTLAARDENLAFILAAYGPPPMWARKPGFETLVRIVLEQPACARFLARKLYRHFVSEAVAPPDA